MVLIIDPQIAGISGDMLLSALVDLGANKNIIIDGIKRSERYFLGTNIKKIDFEKIQKHGIQATRLVLDIDNDIHERKGMEIKKAINDATRTIGLSKQAQLFAESCIDTLISSESKIHGIPKDTVHFHEASSIDTLVDIVGVTIALSDLKLLDEKVTCLPIAVGGGNVTFSHGTMSNPASAILEMFKDSNLIIKGNNSQAELTTPTGACILINLINNVMEYYPIITVDAIGYGAGNKDFKEFANVLKIVRGSKDNLTLDHVKILETNVDDVSGEILGSLIEKIIKQGAKDVTISSGITKKNRPTNIISIICTESNVKNIIDILIFETGTLGVRISDSNRFIVPRSIHYISTVIQGRSFKVSYKKFTHKLKTSFKIEFDDLQEISNNTGMSIKDIESILYKEIIKQVEDTHESFK